MRMYMRLGLLMTVVGAVLAAGAGISASPSTTERVSVDSSGNQGNDNSSGGNISADGRYVVFSSEASNLVPDDTNNVCETDYDEDYDDNCPDVFVHDRQTGQTTRVSVDSAGNQGNDKSSGGAISADDRYVAFFSEASNLVPGDTNGYEDVFVHDRQTGITERISVDSAGNQGNDSSSGGNISADGRYVVFSSEASNLVPGDANSCSDVFVHDRQTGQTTRVSVNSAGNEAYGVMWGGGISADGRYVTLWSEYGDLGGDAGVAQVFVHDRDTDGDGVFDEEGAIATTRVARGNSHSVGGPISADGRYVAFHSGASTLVPGDTNSRWDVFVHDRDTDGDGIFDELGAIATTRVSVDTAGNQGNWSSHSPVLSADGRYVAFSSDASNLVPGDTNGGEDVFLHDRQTGVTERVSVDSAGNEGNGESWGGHMSADGRYVAFFSEASNLVPDDTNGSEDVFVHDRGESPTPGGLTVCPSAEKWAISVWNGPSGTATGDALTTCADVSIDAVYWLDPATQLWWRYFPEWLGISNLLTLDAFQPIIIRAH